MPSAGRMQNGTVWVEPDFPTKTISWLEDHGHKVETKAPPRFGGAQLILRSEEGYIGATDPRKDGKVGLL